MSDPARNQLEVFEYTEDLLKEFWNKYGFSKNIALAAFFFVAFEATMFLTDWQYKGMVGIIYFFVCVVLFAYFIKFTTREIQRGRFR